MFELPPSNPLTLGDIVGKAIRLFRLHYAFFVRVFLVPCLVLQMSLMYLTSISERHAHMKMGLDPAADIAAAINTLLAVTVVAIAFFLKTLRQLAAIRMIVKAPLSYSDALQFVRKRQWLAFFIHSFFTIGILAVVIGWLTLTAAFAASYKAGQISAVGTSIALGFVGLGLTFTVSWFSLVEVIILCVLSDEALPIMGLLKRTFALVKPYLWRGGSFVCVLLVTVLLITLAGELPVALAGMGIDTLKNVQRVPAIHDLPPGSPLIFESFGHVWEALVTIITTGIGVAAAALYYLDVRMRLEGNDILQKIEELK